MRTLTSSLTAGSECTECCNPGWPGLALDCQCQDQEQDCSSPEPGKQDGFMFGFRLDSVLILSIPRCSHPKTLALSLWLRLSWCYPGDFREKEQSCHRREMVLLIESATSYFLCQFEFSGLPNFSKEINDFGCLI